MSSNITEIALLSKFSHTEHWHSILPDVPDVPISAMLVLRGRRMVSNVPVRVSQYNVMIQHWWWEDDKFCGIDPRDSILPNVPDVPISALHLVPDAFYLADVGWHSWLEAAEWWPMCQRIRWHRVSRYNVAYLRVVDPCNEKVRDNTLGTIRLSG